MNQSPKRIVELDGIRGLAILLVLIWHFVGCAVPPGSFVWKTTGLTWCGVDIFFVLSGFLIGGILMDNRNSPQLFRTFYLRRVARIFPLYYAIVSLVFLAFAFIEVRAGALAVAPPSSDVPLWSYWLHLQNIFMSHAGEWGFTPLQVTWSLAVEEQFYLLFPALIYLSTPRLLPLVLFLGFLSGWVVRVLMLHYHPHPGFATYLLLPCRWDALFSGALLAWSVRNRRGVLDSLVVPWFRNVLLGLTVVGGLLLTVADSGIGSTLAAYIGHSFFSFAGCLFIGIGVAVPDSLLGGLFRRRWLCYLGTISYSLYLTHGLTLRAVYWLCSSSGRPQINSIGSALIACLALVLAIALASLSWHFFESPILKRVHKHSSY